MQLSSSRSGRALDATPTGIIQFDIDLQGNEDTDFDDLKQMVITVPECIYALRSPSGGLKFGILTDFQQNIVPPVPARGDVVEGAGKLYA